MGQQTAERKFESPSSHCKSESVPTWRKLCSPTARCSFRYGLWVHMRPLRPKPDTCGVAQVPCCGHGAQRRQLPRNFAHSPGLPGGRFGALCNYTAPIGWLSSATGGSPEQFCAGVPARCWGKPRGGRRCARPSCCHKHFFSQSDFAPSFPLLFLSHSHKYLITRFVRLKPPFLYPKSQLRFFLDFASIYDF